MTVLAGGSDFVSAPRLSPDGKQLAWIAWDHPNMPWDDTVLYLADVTSDGSLSNQRKVRHHRADALCFISFGQPDARSEALSPESYILV